MDDCRYRSHKSFRDYRPALSPSVEWYIHRAWALPPKIKPINFLWVVKWSLRRLIYSYLFAFTQIPSPAPAGLRSDSLKIFLWLGINAEPCTRYEGYRSELTDGAVSLILPVIYRIFSAPAHLTVKLINPNLHQLETKSLSFHLAAYCLLLFFILYNPFAI